MQEKEIELLDNGSNKCCRVAAALSQPKFYPHWRWQCIDPILG